MLFIQMRALQVNVYTTFSCVKSKNQIIGSMPGLKAGFEIWHELASVKPIHYHIENMCSTHEICYSTNIQVKNFKYLLEINIFKNLSLKHFGFPVCGFRLFVCPNGWGNVCNTHGHDGPQL